LVQIGDLDGYRRHCQSMLSRWKDTDDVLIAVQTAELCLITPEVVAAPDELTRIVETALSANPAHSYYAYFLLLKGLHAYRTGDFAAATEACRAIRLRNLGTMNIASVSAAADAIEAMAEHQLGHVPEARLRLAATSRALDQQFAELQHSGDLGEHWVDWLIARILAREAATLADAN
jgi:rhamnose utilization protein RhaD (predicted bifunctional aldolase and dehydrogenase)